MSSSGRNDVGGPTLGNSGDIKCQKIYKPINLLSGDPAVLGKIQVGTELNLLIEEINGNKSLRLVYQNEYVGSITSFASQIINCIEQQGHTYVAVVLSMEGGSCVVEVRMIS